jgi:hypothetical protein
VYNLRQFSLDADLAIVVRSIWAFWPQDPGKQQNLRRTDMQLLPFYDIIFRRILVVSMNFNGTNTTSANVHLYDVMSQHRR